MTSFPCRREGGGEINERKQPLRFKLYAGESVSGDERTVWDDIMRREDSIENTLDLDVYLGLCRTVPVQSQEALFRLSLTFFSTCEQETYYLISQLHTLSPEKTPCYRSLSINVRKCLQRPTCRGPKKRHVNSLLRRYSLQFADDNLSFCLGTGACEGRLGRRCRPPHVRFFISLRRKLLGEHVVIFRKGGVDSHFLERRCGLSLAVPKTLGVPPWGTDVFAEN